MASVFLKESMTRRKWVSIFIAIIGALIVSFN
jgi:drug/metabolite transporter (DMT)-like permease